jgi:autotransporter-associated beta strand protein
MKPYQLPPLLAGSLRSGLVVVLGVAFLLGPLGSTTYAAYLTWDPAATGGTAGGNGVWDSASWWTGSHTDVLWPSGTDAAFNGTAGTVSLVNPITAGNLSFITSGYLLTGNMLTLTGGSINVATGSATISSAIAGSGNSGLTQTGAGLLVLNGPASYTGPTTISSGSLMINNTDTTSSISVGLATVLGGMGSASSGTATFASSKGTLAPGYGGAGNLTLGGLNLGTLSNTVAVVVPTISDATSTPCVDVLGNLTYASGTIVNFNLSGGALSGSGSIPLLYAGSNISSLTSGISANKVKLTNQSSINGNGTLSLSVNAATGYLYLNYSGYSYLVWSGSGNGVWATGAQSPANWQLAGGTSGAANFTNNQAVVFSDTAAGTTVSVSGIVSPGSVTFNNNSLSYSLTGAGGIAGYTSLIMNGSGALTIGASNSYYGGTTINAGRLNIANSAALGGPTAASTYGTFAINGGTIDNASGAALTLPNYPIAWNAGFVERRFCLPWQQSLEPRFGRHDPRQ